MIIEIAYALLAVALIIFVIYLTITVKNLGEKAGKMLDETENTRSSAATFSEIRIESL